MKNLKLVLYGLGVWVWSLLLIYVVSMTVYYRLQHPEMTETELFLKIPEALLLK